MKSVLVIWASLAAVSIYFTYSEKRKSHQFLQLRIYGGRTASKGQFPYQVLLNTKDGDSIYSCGGAIISRDHVLTAAHCVDTAENSPELITVYAGSINYITGAVEKRVSRVTIHPAYVHFNNDVAILKLNSSLDFNGVINDVRLAKANIPDDAPVIVSGWGVIGKNKSTNVLQYNTEYSISRAECLRLVYRLGDTMRCMRRPVGQGICMGDSGGPAVHKGKLIGVNSYIIGDCGSGKPDVFTDVVATREWIINNME